MLRHLFVAVKCDKFISSYPEVVSSSVWGDAGTRNLHFIIKGQMRHLLWVETKQWYLNVAMLIWWMLCYLMWVKLCNLSCAVGERVVFLTVAALFCSLGYPFFKIHTTTSLKQCWSLIMCFIKQSVSFWWMGGRLFPSCPVRKSPTM